MKYTLLIALSLILGNVATAQGFSENTTHNFVSLYQSATAWGDYDSDDDFDLIICGLATSGQVTKLYRNDGAGTFTEVSIDIDGVHKGSINWTDYNKDGNLDIFITGNTGTDIVAKLYQGNGAGGFTEIQSGTFTAVDRSASGFADFDGDGWDDLVVSGHDGSEGTTTIYQNNQGTFESKNTLTGVFHASVDIDYNEEGYPDLLITGLKSKNDKSTVHYINRHSSFMLVPNDDYKAVTNGTSDFIDLDADGHRTIFITGQSDSKLEAYSSEFASLQTNIDGVQNGMTGWADADFDGDLDLLISGEASDGTLITEYYENTLELGAVNFVKRTDLSLIGLMNGTIDWVDLDGDKDLDILITGTNGVNPVSKVYCNNTNNSYSIPKKPSQLLAIPDFDFVTIFWEKEPNEHEVEKSPARYELFIGKDSIEVIFQFNQSTQLKVIDKSLFSIRQKTIGGWSEGKYYYAVRSYDFNGNPSEISNLSSFVILGAPNLQVRYVDSTAFDLYWHPVIGALKYRVDLSKYNYWSGITEPDWTGGKETSDTSIRVDYLEPGVDYYVSVTSVNGDQNCIQPRHRKLGRFSASELYPSKANEIRSVDYNRDGKHDILIQNQSGNGILINESNGNFRKEKSPMPPMASSRTTILDFNNDNRPDFTVTGFQKEPIKKTDSSNFSKIYLSKSQIDTAFYNSLDIHLQSCIDISHSDLNNDGAQEFIISYKQDNQSFTEIFKFKRDSLHKLSNSEIKSHPVISDIDGDGITEIIVFSNSEFEVFQLSKSNIVKADHFATGRNSDTLLINKFSDIDGDGNQEILSYNSGNLYLSEFSNGQLDNNLVTLEIGSNEPHVLSALGDFNNDGFTDILNISDSRSYFTPQDGWLYPGKHNSLNHSLEMRTEVNDFLGYSIIEISDYDNDHDLDIIGFNQLTEKLWVTTNNNTYTNTPPKPITNLKASLGQDSIRFTWDRASDGQTPALGLNYNMYVKHIDSTEKFIVSPMADLQTGWRYIPERGMIQDTTWFLRYTNMTPGTYIWSVQAIDASYAGGQFAVADTFVYAPQNSPTDITLSANTIQENRSVGSEIGTFTTLDLDNADSHTYSLITSGSGDESHFTISKNRLLSNKKFDFETKSSYSIKVKSTDLSELSFEKNFIITIMDINESIDNNAPTDITLSSSNVFENQTVGTPVGFLSTTDIDMDDSHIYNLVSGDGDTDNDQFLVDEGLIRTKEIFDYEAKKSFSIRVETTDNHGGTFSKSFTIIILDVNDGISTNNPPTNIITLSKLEIAENNAMDDLITSLIAIDPDSGDSHTFSLIGGLGSTGNSSFYIMGNSLRANEVFDFERQSSFTIRTKAQDDHDSSFIKVLTIEILDANDAPTDILTDSKAEINENNNEGIAIAILSAADQDHNDSHTFTLLQDIDSFYIDGNVLRANTRFDYEKKSRYSVLVQVEDQDKAKFAKHIEVSILDIDESLPTFWLSNDRVVVGTKPGTIIGQFHGHSDSIVYSLENGSGFSNDMFEIEGSYLKTKKVISSTQSLPAQIKGSHGFLTGIQAFLIEPFKREAKDVVVQGTTVSSFRIFGLPMSELTVGKTFSGLKENMKDWRVLSYSNGKYTDLNATSLLNPGVGYWINSADPLIIDISEGNPIQLNDNQEFVTPLAIGWNMIANPFFHKISRNDIVEYNLNNGTLTANEANVELYTWNGAYQETNELDVYEGAFIYSERRVDLKVKADVSASGSRELKSHSHFSSLNDWSLQLRLHNNTKSTNVNKIGMHPLAQVGVDTWDGVKLPSLGNDFGLEESNTGLIRSYVNPQTSQEWTFDVHGLGDLTLSWDHHIDLPIGRDLRLALSPQNKIVDMRSQNQINFSSRHKQQVKILYGDAHFTNLPINAQVTPNPSDGKVTFNGMIIGKENQHLVVIDVYSVHGIKVEGILVKAMTNQVMSHETLLDLPSGVYFYTMSYDDQLSPMQKLVIK